MAKVMVVDDEVNVVYIVEKMLKKSGFETAHAYTGGEALKTLKKEKPDLVLLDIMMPGLSGWEVLEKIREDKELRATPVCMLTVKKPTVEMLQSKNIEGLVDYVVKPFTEEKLISSVKRALETIARVRGMVKKLGKIDPKKAEEYERIVKAEAVNRSLLDLLRQVLERRRKESLVELLSFENVLKSMSRQLEEYEMERGEIEALLKK